MNIQAMMKQAQALQKEMLKEKDAIDEMEFLGESSFVKVTVNGKKEILKVEINNDENLQLDDLDMLSDMFVIATNNAMKMVDEMITEKMGKFGNMPGLF